VLGAFGPCEDAGSSIGVWDECFYGYVEGCFFEGEGYEVDVGFGFYSDFGLVLVMVACSAVGVVGVCVGLDYVECLGGCLECLFYFLGDDLGEGH